VACASTTWRKARPEAFLNRLSVGKRWYNYGFFAASNGDMRVIRNRPEWIGGAITPARSVVAIGNFDGMHRGHQALVERCKSLAQEGDEVAVVTFEPLPPAFFSPQNAPARLSTVYQKLGLLRAAGVDITWLMRFGRQLASLTSTQFAEQILVEKLNARCVVIGEDFRFGRGREGDVSLLTKLGRERGFTVEPVAEVLCGGERISSSGIRQRLAAGDFSAVAERLGRPFRMEGHVTRGAGLGRTLGYPTANLRMRAEPSPLGGVLAAYARVANGPWLPTVTNLGRRPVVDGKETLLEVHFFDFNEDLYGQRLDVQFVAKLRDELNFGSLDDLVEQMKRDEYEARSILAETVPPEDTPVG
jgi:riboflavin kinase/FMN adenylyltransferase